MNYEIFDLITTKAVYKFLSKQDEKTRKRLIKAMEGLRQFPPSGDIKPLKQDVLNGYLRLRVGSFRIIFKADLNEKVIYIRSVDNRGDAYK